MLNVVNVATFHNQKLPMRFLNWIKGFFKDPQFMVWEKKNLLGRLSYSFYSVLSHQLRRTVGVFVSLWGWPVGKQ